MELYDKYVLPKVIDWACSQKPTMKQREKVVPEASGHVLEIGIGSGLNLSFYNREKVKSVTGIDPSETIWNENKIDASLLPFAFQFKRTGAEELPLGNQSIDSVVVTYTLCTIPDLSASFAEFRRVIKPEGRLLFCEHGKAPSKSVARWQNLINPVWKRIGGGCNLNRDIPELIEKNGFKISQMETMYIPGWKPASFNYWGTAKVR